MEFAAQIYYQDQLLIPEEGTEDILQTFLQVLAFFDWHGGRGFGSSILSLLLLSY